MTDEHTSDLVYENVEDWKTWHRKVAEDLSVIVPKGATADVTISVDLEDRSTTETEGN